MKRVLFLAILLIAVSCTNSQTPIENNEEINGFITALDDKSLDEILVEINDNIDQFERFIEFFDGTFGNEIEKIKKEDEIYDSIFEIDTTGIAGALHQFDNVQFTQTFGFNQSNLKFNFKSSDKRKPNELGSGVAHGFTPNKIYYHDGTTKSENIENNEVDFIFMEDDWGPAKPIDSVDITYEINYLTEYDVVELSVDNPKVNYKNGVIKLEKTQDNFAYITFSDTISNYVTIQGYNAEGKILDRKGSSSNAIAPKDSKNIFTEMGKYFKTLQKKLNDGDFKDTAEFQNYLSKNLSKLAYFNDKDGLHHFEYYYHGTVDSFKIYFEKDIEHRQTDFTARNVRTINNDELFNMQTDNGLVFFNIKGEIEMTIKASEEGVSKLGGDFYEDQNYFYHLNRDKKRLDTLLVLDIKAYNNGIVGIKFEQRSEPFSLFTGNNKPIGNTKYISLKDVGNTLFGLRDNQYYVIDAQGKETLVPGAIDIYNDIVDDRIIVVNSNRKYGFINSKGKLMLPFKYDSVSYFEDGITAVKFDGTYKLIDVNGNILVDTKEEFLNASRPDHQGKRIYNFDFGAKIYNYKGELISEKKE